MQNFNRDPVPDPASINNADPCGHCGSRSISTLKYILQPRELYITKKLTSIVQGTAASNDRHWEQKNTTEAKEEEVIFLAGGSSTTDDDLSLRLQGLNRGEEEGEGEEVTVLEKEGQEVIHLDQEEEEEVKSFLCFYLCLIPR